MISQKTKELAIAVILRHVDLERAIRLFEELSGVPGNASFQLSVTAMYSALVDARPNPLQDAARGRDALRCPECHSVDVTRHLHLHDVDSYKCDSCGCEWTKKYGVKGGDA